MPDRLLSPPDYFTLMLYMNRTLASALRDTEGITLEQFRILGYLSSRNRICLQSEIAKDLQIAKSAASMSLGALLEQNALVLEVGEAAGNRKGFSLTRRGSALFRRSRRTAENAYHRVLASIGREQEQTLEHLVVAIAGRLNAFSFSDGAIDVLLATIEVSSKTKQIFSRFVKKYGLSESEYRILHALLAADDPLRQRDLARTLLMKRATVCVLCKKLEARRLVTCQANPDDKRSVTVGLTYEGARIVASCSQAYESHFMEDVHAMMPGENAFFMSLDAASMKGLRRAFRD